MLSGGATLKAVADLRTYWFLHPISPAVAREARPDLKPLARNPNVMYERAKLCPFCAQFFNVLHITRTRAARAAEADAGLARGRTDAASYRTGPDRAAREQPRLLWQHARRTPCAWHGQSRRIAHRVAHITHHRTHPPRITDDSIRGRHRRRCLLQALPFGRDAAR